MSATARLTSVMLARKGEAIPTGGFAHAKLALIPPPPTAAKRDRRCWEAVGSDGESATGRRLARTPRRRRVPDGDIQATGDRVAFTVRLDRERHRRLKLLAARRGRSRQEMLLRALDAYLEACALDPGVPPSRKLAAES